MKLKVGILTYHASINMGSMLQSYALQEVLKELGCEVRFINFSSLGQKNLYKLINPMQGIKGALKSIINLAVYPILRGQQLDFLEFKNKYLDVLDREFSDPIDVISDVKELDLVVFGSDQIWNVNCHDFDWIYFGENIEGVKKVAYAPSFGGTNICNLLELRDKITNLFFSFDHLSVREYNGKRWIKELSNINAEVVADPTILIDSCVWRNMSESTSVDISGDYIFFYGVPFDPETYLHLKAFSRKVDMPIYMLDAKSYIYQGVFFKGIRLIRPSGPLNFLSLIRDAFLVLTTSFHGSIFATHFQKKFYSLTFEGTNKDDDRLSYLLTQLGLSDRFILSSELGDVDFESDIYWPDVMTRVETMKYEGLRFLTGAVNEA